MRVCVSTRRHCELGNEIKEKKICVHTRISYVFKCIIQTHTNETTDDEDDVPRRLTRPKFRKNIKLRDRYTRHFSDFRTSFYYTVRAKLFRSL